MSNTGGRFSYMVVFPSLPKGIMLDTTTGKISGTPTEITDSKKYTIAVRSTQGFSERNNN